MKLNHGPWPDPVFSIMCMYMCHLLSYRKFECLHITNTETMEALNLVIDLKPGRDSLV